MVESRLFLSPIVIKQYSKVSKQLSSQAAQIVLHNVRSGLQINSSMHTCAAIFSD